MDLVENRKKAKTKKPKKKAADKVPAPKASKKIPDRKEEPAPEPEAVQAVSEEVAEEQMPREKEEKVHAVKKEIVSTLTTLDDVLMSQRDEVKEEEEEQLQLLTFQLGGEEYALNIMDIKEIIRPRETTEVPRTPDYIMGIFSLRGAIIPVFDVSLRLGLPKSERGPQNRIVVVKSQEHLFGLHVDSVIQVLDIPLSRIEPPPEILGGVEGEFLRGIGRIEDRLIILLNLDRILKLDEIRGSENLELPSD